MGQIDSLTVVNYNSELAFTLDPGALAAACQTNLVLGLSTPECQLRQLKYGLNALEKGSRIQLGALLFKQFKSPIVWILIGAGLLAFMFEQHAEAIAILVVIIINACIGFYMEWEAIRSMNALIAMTRSRARVVRDGQTTIVDSTELVPGDILCVTSGDLITADARLFITHNLALKEAALTGESVDIDKDIATLPPETVLADRENCIFAGTIVTRGHGKAIVFNTGVSTELGKISSLTKSVRKEMTPLDKRLNGLSKTLIWITVIMALGIFMIGIWRGVDGLLMIETAVALAVAAIPEGLPVIATITLARGMVQLARKNAIVKSLQSVQTLGEANVILTDKTGTLTENDMHLQAVVTSRGHITVEELLELTACHQTIEKDIKSLFDVGALCNDSFEINRLSFATGGDPIDNAILKVYHSLFGPYDHIVSANPRISEIPFDADLKLMMTLNKTEQGFNVNVKGAIESVLERCTHVLNNRGLVVPLTAAHRTEWLNLEAHYASKGFRLLSFATRTTEERPQTGSELTHLIFIGLAAFIDPPRRDIKDALKSCRQAGIRVVMVTGDHPETAENIAHQVGMITAGKGVKKMHGRELKKHTENGASWLLDVDIFARTTPSQKLDLVELFQRNHFVVAMTGDGLNDTPALKKADIGIAMGRRGTEAAKEVADIILKDDSFASIVLAIRQGRMIFKNIRSFVVYLLSCNLSEIMVVGFASALALPLPLLPLQILFLNMVTDVFPALALGMNKGDVDVMKESPRKPEDPIISRPYWYSIMIYGFTMAMTVLAVEWIALNLLEAPARVANNMTFFTLILVQLWNVFNLPDHKTSLWRNEITQNKYIWLSFVISLLMIYTVWLIPPVREALALTSLTLQEWSIVITFSVLPNLIIQFLKRTVHWIH